MLKSISKLSVIILTTAIIGSIHPTNVGAKDLPKHKVISNEQIKTAEWVPMAYLRFGAAIHAAPNGTRRFPHVGMKELFPVKQDFVNIDGTKWVKIVTQHDSGWVKNEDLLYIS